MKRPETLERLRRCQASIYRSVRRHKQRHQEWVGICALPAGHAGEHSATAMPGTVVRGPLEVLRDAEKKRKLGV